MNVSVCKIDRQPEPYLRCYQGSAIERDMMGVRLGPKLHQVAIASSP
jgi:hypothetical protein